MQKNTRNRKLTLQTTTLRTLGADKLEVVAAGAKQPTRFVSCFDECPGYP